MTSLLLLSYNMKTSLICCMNGNRTIEVLVSQCKTVFFPLFPSLSSTSSSRGNCTDCRHSPLSYTDRKNVTDFLYLVLHLARKVTCYFRVLSSVLVSELRTSINVLLKSKSKNYVTWIANLTKLFLSVL